MICLNTHTSSGTHTHPGSHWESPLQKGCHSCYTVGQSHLACNGIGPFPDCRNVRRSQLGSSRREGRCHSLSDGNEIPESRREREGQGRRLESWVTGRGMEGAKGRHDCRQRRKGQNKEPHRRNGGGLVEQRECRH